MATRSTAELNRAADAWENDCGYSSAVLSGIVGDARHRAQGGYHISIEDNPRGNYSIVRKDDAAPPGSWPRDRAAAIDMSMSKPDMIKCYKRVHAVWSNPNDPRRKYINAVNCWDGTGDAVRLDFVTGKASFATPDHKWHNHGERRRRDVNDPEATRAEISMYKGESLAQYLGSSDTSVPVPSGSPTLRNGSTGTAVQQLQVALNEAIDAGLRVDGDFGTATESALKEFQRSAGLDDDGIYGTGTAAALREELSMPTAKEVAAEVKKELIDFLRFEVDADVWAGQGTGRLAHGTYSLGVGARNGWAYGKVNLAEMRKLAGLPADVAELAGRVAGLTSLVQQLLSAPPVQLTPEQLVDLTQAVQAAAREPGERIEAALVAAGEALAGVDDEAPDQTPA